MRNDMLKENLDNIPDYIIDSTILSIKTHREMYDVKVPYKWMTGNWQANDTTRLAPVSNMKHITTDDSLQQYPELYFENLMLPYIYPKIAEWIKINKPEFVGINFHTRSSWYMIYDNDRDTYTPDHHHKNQAKRTHGLNQIECCSGVFYLSTSGDETRTFEYYDENGNTVVTYPKNKDLILFPTDMIHAAYQRGSKIASVAIAFNVLFYKDEENGIDSKE